MTKYAYYLLISIASIASLLGCSGAPSNSTEEAVGVVTSPATDQDNGSGTSACSSVVLPTYPLNRLWDPTNSKFGCPCVTTAGYQGSMVSRCAVVTNTCGYLFCIRQ